MRHLTARYNDYFVIGLEDRAYLVFDAGPGKGTIVELLKSDDPQAVQKAASATTPATAPATTPATTPVTTPVTAKVTSSEPDPSSKNNNNNNSNNNNSEQEQEQEHPIKVHDRQKSSDEQLNEICAVAIIGDKENSILRCAVARNNKSLNIYNVKLDELLQTSTSIGKTTTTTTITATTTTTRPSSIVYRTPKRVSCFTFANLANTTAAAAAVVAAAAADKTVPLLISGDVAGDSYAYNLLEEGQRLLLGHTASMLTDICIVNGNEDGNIENESTSTSISRLLLTSDRDEQIRISRFPDSYVIEGFLLGHTAYVTAFAVIQDPFSSSSSSSLVVSCGGDMTVRLWNLGTTNEICSTSTNDNNNKKEIENESDNEIPTAIAASCCGTIVAVIFDDSKRLSIFKIIETKKNEEGQGDDDDDVSLELLGSVDCPSQPLSVAFHEDANGGTAVLTVLMKDPDYIVLYDIQYNQDDNKTNDKPIAVPRSESDAGVMQALRDVASEEKLSMPNTILEKDDYGNPVLRKENETRGPSQAEAPWNRVERVEIAKEREKRRTKNKKPKLDNN